MRSLLATSYALERQRMNDGRILVGAIAGSFGVKGEVRLKSFCSNPVDIQLYSPLLAENKKTYTLNIINPIKNGFTARLSGITSKGEADSLRGLKLYVNRSRLPTLPDDEYYYSDLIGLLVLDTGGEHLGTVSAVLNHGAGDIIEIKTICDTNLLLPFTKEIVPTIDVVKQCIIVDLSFENEILDQDD